MRSAAWNRMKECFRSRPRPRWSIPSNGMEKEIFIYRFFCLWKLFAVQGAHIAPARRREMCCVAAVAVVVAQCVLILHDATKNVWMQNPVLSFEHKFRCHDAVLCSRTHEKITVNQRWFARSSIRMWVSTQVNRPALHKTNKMFSDENMHMQ